MRGMHLEVAGVVGEAVVPEHLQSRYFRLGATKEGLM
jgi:hypothetical protein